MTTINPANAPAAESPGPTPPRPDRAYPTPSPSVGLVVATFAAVPYVHLHLETWARHGRRAPLLVCDDGSPFSAEIRELCDRYGASFIANRVRLRQSVGDLSAYVHGLDWAAARGLDILVKMSRRFLPCFDWLPGLQRLAWESQMPTFSQSCDHFNFGFRTECIGFHCTAWRGADACGELRSRVERNEPVFVEAFIHGLARTISRHRACPAAEQYVRAHPRGSDRDGYAPWAVMPDRRTTRSPGLLWHDCDSAFDYARVAALYGLDYTVRDFEDPNQGCGQGEP